MRKKVWLLREEDGNYTICKDKPALGGSYLPYSSRPRSIVKNLCNREVKQWFGLKKHLAIDTCVQGYFTVSFTPIKKNK